MDTKVIHDLQVVKTIYQYLATTRFWLGGRRWARALLWSELDPRALVPDINHTILDLLVDHLRWLHKCL
jgi:hypothetical protein